MCPVPCDVKTYQGAAPGTGTEQGWLKRYREIADQLGKLGALDPLTPMFTASSQKLTYLAFASASEYIATVFMAIRIAVAATRQAISPLFAMSIFLTLGLLSVRLKKIRGK